MNLFPSKMQRFSSKYYLGFTYLGSSLDLRMLSSFFRKLTSEEFQMNGQRKDLLLRKVELIVLDQNLFLQIISDVKTCIYFSFRFEYSALWCLLSKFYQSKIYTCEILRTSPVQQYFFYIVNTATTGLRNMCSGTT